VLDRIESRFSRYEPLRHAAGLMLGGRPAWTARIDLHEPIAVMPNGVARFRI
jgi:hypothetical protein